MFIQFNSFIPAHLGKSLFAWVSQELDKYPVDNRNQILGEVIRLNSALSPRTWIKEPVNDLSYCTTDGRDFAEHNLFLSSNDSQSSRLYFYSNKQSDISRNGIDLDYIGSFKQLYRVFPFHVKFGPTYKAGVRLKANYGHSVQNTREGLLIANPKVACHYGHYRAQNYKGFFFSDRKQVTDQDAWFQKGNSMVDVNRDCSIIIINGEGGYPFAEPFAPNIDMSLKIIFKRKPNHIEVIFSGFHNKFPFYEILIDGKVQYRYEVTDKGPGFFNLNSRVSFSFSIQVPRKTNYLNKYTNSAIVKDSF